PQRLATRNGQVEHAGQFRVAGDVLLVDRRFVPAASELFECASEPQRVDSGVVPETVEGEKTGRGAKLLHDPDVLVDSEPAEELEVGKPAFAEPGDVVRPLLIGLSP